AAGSTTFLPVSMRSAASTRRGGGRWKRILPSFCRVSRSIARWGPRRLSTSSVSDGDHHLADLLVGLEELVRCRNLVEAVEGAGDHGLQLTARQSCKDLFLRSFEPVWVVPDFARHPPAHR